MEESRRIVIGKEVNKEKSSAWLFNGVQIGGGPRLFQQLPEEGQQFFPPSSPSALDFPGSENRHYTSDPRPKTAYDAEQARRLSR